MIFVTVGTQMPFDRLVRAVDDWAGGDQRIKVFAQIGPTDYRPEHLEWSESITPAKFRQYVRQASLIVSHAGIGTVLSALELRKPIVVMPRRAALGEHRNDHQLATVKHLSKLVEFNVARCAEELKAVLDRSETLRPVSQITSTDSGEFLGSIQQFVSGGGGHNHDRNYFSS